MKTWITPGISELNINETANGFFDATCEFWWITNDDKKCKPEDPVNEQS